MRVSEILSQDRIAFVLDDFSVDTKAKAIQLLSQLLTKAKDSLNQADIEKILNDREELQSTGIGGGVAIPHGFIENDILSEHIAALLLIPKGIQFEAVDHAPVNIIFAIIGPKQANVDHLKLLARISRLLRSKEFRSNILEFHQPDQILSLIATEELRATTS